MAQNVSIDEMADAIVNGLTDYADLTAEEMKKAVKDAAVTVQKEIGNSAPQLTGKYKKSWAVKMQEETSTSLEMVVYSKNRYQLSHLLEKGHAKRGGGRVGAIPHIAPAEEKGLKQLEENIERGIS